MLRADRHPWTSETGAKWFPPHLDANGQWEQHVPRSVDGGVLCPPSGRRIWILRRVMALDRVWKRTGGFWDLEEDMRPLCIY